MGPGTPGAPWTDYELLTVKAKLFRLFRYGISAPAVLRLGFHDCLKYKDGTGGCDGCLNWHGMEHRFGQDGQDIAHSRSQENVPKIKRNNDCCKDVPEGQFCKADRAGPNDPDTSPNNWSPLNQGCERFRFISGADEIALNAEMGLYREFEVTDGIIHGCPGLEIFNKTMSDTSKKTTVWSKGEDGWNGEPRCEKQRLEEPPGSGEPLHTIFEEYADDQAVWMRDYVPAMEKMLANGYETGLVDAPDFTTGVVCPFPSGAAWQTVWSCYRNEAAGSGPAYVIRSDCIWDGFQTKGRVVQAGVDKEEMWSFTGSDKQLWKWSESGNQLINVATGKPFSVGGFTEWRVARPNDGDILETQYGGKALDAWVARDNGCGGELIVGNTHGGAGQWFSLVS